MNKIIKWIAVLLLAISLSKSMPVVAQPKTCGKYLIDASALQAAERFDSRNQPTIVNRLVRVYFHICRNNNGSNAGATLVQIQNEFNQLVIDYAANNLCFANMGVNYIDNTQINTMLNPDSASNVAWLAPFLVPNCINVFYHANLVNYGGNAYSIPNTYCSVDRGNINTWHTISHEVGHCLGLMHTFEPAYGIEYINGTDCGIRGDRVCDTPADPWSFNGMPCFTTFGCIYTGYCTDPNGASNYSPPNDNIMSYWGVRGCTLTQFTNGQYARANTFLNTNLGLLNTQSPSTVFYGPLTITSGFEMKSAIFGFASNGNVFLGGTVLASLQGQSVLLNPGFLASPSTGTVLIRPTTCNY